MGSVNRHIDLANSLNLPQTVEMLGTTIEFLSNSLTLVVLVGYVFALWAALVVWTYLDASERTDNYFYRFGSVLLVATGSILGFAIYLLLRPSGTKEEERMKEIEEAILSSQAHLNTCPNCYSIVKEEYVYCTSCSLKLQAQCQSCSKDINIAWGVCPYCGFQRQRVEAGKRLEGEKAVAFESRKVSLKSSPAIFSTIINYLKQSANARNKARAAKETKPTRAKARKNSRVSRKRKS